MFQKKNNLFTLFCIIFIDLVGVGILIPVLAPLFLDPAASIVPTSWSNEARNIALGFLIAAYPLAQFFGSPILGTLSDHHGRKRLLSLSLMGTILGYVLFAVGLYTNQLWLLYVSRILDGFTGGNIGVANSAISDMSTPETRTKNFGLVGMAFGLGFIIGPFLGGLLADPSLVSWFSSATPFWFAAGLSTINLLLVEFAFKETLKTRVAKKIHAFIGFSHLAKAVKMHKLRSIFIVIFLHSLGFCFFTQFFPVFLVQKFHFQEAAIGAMFGYIGIWIAFCQGFLTRHISKYFAPEKVLRVSMLGLSVSLFLSVLSGNVTILYLLQPILAVFEGLNFPNETSIVSKLSSAEDQGESLGITQSLRALGQAIPPIAAGFLVSVDQNLPTLTAAALILLAWAVFMIFFRSKPLIR